MRVSKRLAIFGFNVCASVFLGLSVYGILVYVDESAPKHASPLAVFLYAACAIGCIAGICFFGSQWDTRNAEDAKRSGKTVPARTNADGR